VLPGPAGVPVRIYRGRGPAEGPSAAIVFLHGGGWVVGDLDTHDAVCRLLAVESGAVVIAVGYRCAPEHPFPAAHQDALAATAWVMESADALGVAADRVCVIGDSAGGNLAAHVARTAAQDRLPGPVRSQALLYPVLDLTMSTRSYARVTSGFPLTAASMRWFADASVPDPADRTRAELSPLLHPVPPELAPLLIVTVGHDPLADEGIAYAAAVASAGRAVEHHHLPHHAHGLITSAGRIATGRALLSRVADFARRTTEPR
jgi:acetyl esterase